MYVPRGAGPHTSDAQASHPHLMHDTGRCAPPSEGRRQAHTGFRISVQRSRGTIEPAAVRAGRQVVGADGKLIADGGLSGDRNDGGQNPRKAGVQGATRIRQVPAVIVPAAHPTLVVVALCMMMDFEPIHLGRARLRRRGRHRQGICARRRHHARELGDQEQANQQAGKPGYGPQQFHTRCLNRLHGARNYGSIAVERQRAGGRAFFAVALRPTEGPNWFAAARGRRWAQRRARRAGFTPACSLPACVLPGTEIAPTPA